MPTFIFFFVAVILSCGSLLSAAAQIHHGRRILHHPLFPVNSPPPHPKQPVAFLSPPNHGNPFFPLYRSPPSTPPPATSLATFPANISSLILPRSPSPKPISRKLVAVAVSLSLFSAAIVAATAAFLVYHRRHRILTVDGASKTKRWGLFPPNTTTSDGVPRLSRNVSSTCSKFLYLGILGGIDEGDYMASTSSNVGASSKPDYHNLGSPELQQLPPLPRQSLRESCPNAEVGSGREDEDGEEDFFSPRASFGGKRSPPGFVSSSRGENSGAGAQNFGNSTNSSPSSENFSPIRLRSRSPESSIDFLGPSYSAPPQTMAQSPPNGKLSAPSPSSTPQNKDSEQTQSPTSLGPALPLQIPQSPARSAGASRQFFPVKFPQPPPPQPPPRFSEIPIPPPASNCEQIKRTTVNFATPSIENPELISVSVPVLPIDQTKNLEIIEGKEEHPKPKLKPLHWDKVRASSDRAMVWDQLKSSSFQLNEEMIEKLFVANSSSLAAKDGAHRPISPIPNPENRVLDPKKSQNIAILLRALNVTIDEICEALQEGSADTLEPQLLESLLKMAPTKEEEHKLKELKEEHPLKLGPAENFLKAVLDIPFAFQRVAAMLYIANFDAEIDYLKRSFDTLEAACKELRDSRMFLKLLEAVLKTGNRMNDGTNRGDARAFKLDTLLKLADVKGTDGKTSLLHFVVHEISRAEGFRLNQAPAADKSPQLALKDEIKFKKLGLQVISGLSGELTNVKKAAAMDSEVLSSELRKLANGLTKIREVLRLTEEVSEKDCNQTFTESMKEFLKNAEAKIVKIQAHESVALCLVKEITEYFHGDLAREEARPFRIFMVVRDFLSILDRVCKEVGKINEHSAVSSTPLISIPSKCEPLVRFPGLLIRKQHGSSSDESNSQETL